MDSGCSIHMMEEKNLVTNMTKIEKINLTIDGGELYGIERKDIMDIYIYINNYLNNMNR